MAAVTLTNYSPTSVGLTSATAVYENPEDTAGFLINNSQATLIILRNSHTSTINATIVSPGNVDGLAIADRSITIPASGGVVYLRLPPEIYNNSVGQVTITFPSFGTGVAGNIYAIVFNV